MTLAGGGGIFVSYRRQDSKHLAGRLYEHLTARFGRDRVFIDVHTIEPGVDFSEEIFRAVAGCTVLLAIIGPAWLTAADEQGRRRLDDPDDTVRLEIEAALARGVLVIPILADGAVIPAGQDLPESLAGLARRHALPIRHDSFWSDAGYLITAIEPVLDTMLVKEIVPPAELSIADRGQLQDDGHSQLSVRVRKMPGKVVGTCPQCGYDIKKSNDISYCVNQLCSNSWP